MIHAMGNLEPRTAGAAFVAWNAEVAGDVELGADSSVWFGATVRADVDSIRIGQRSNVQDGAVVHVDEGHPCVVGDDVTVGHRAVLHGCEIGDGCLVGMGAIVLDGARIGPGCVVGAGALVTQGKEFPARSLILGSPARVVRAVSDEDAARAAANAAEYVRLARLAAAYRRVDAGTA